MKRHFLRKTRVFLLISFFFDTMINAKTDFKLDINLHTGGVSELNIKNDIHNMNWLVRTDGIQYPWVKEHLAWGLGYFTITKGHETVKKEWNTPIEISADGMNATYREGDIRIQVNRVFKNNDLIEEYTFVNEGKEEVSLHDIGIYTPFNDNYPGAKECIDARANVQIWEGENAAYVNALCMGGAAPHLGLVFTKGAVKSYEIWERGRKTANSHYRGIFALNLPDTFLKPNESYSVAWTLFTHDGYEDFKRK